MWQNGWVGSSQSSLWVKWVAGQNGSFLNGLIVLRVNRVGLENFELFCHVHQNLESPHNICVKFYKKMVLF